MSTRSNIIVTDGHRRIQIYRHMDGYPDAVLDDLPAALEFAWQLPRYEATDFAAAIVRAWKRPGGGNVYIDGSVNGFELVHGDTEWVYLIEHGANEPVVSVYDWHDYWLDKANTSLPNFKPKVIWSGNLSECKATAANWEDHG